MWNQSNNSFSSKAREGVWGKGWQALSAAEYLLLAFWVHPEEAAQRSVSLSTQQNTK